MSSIALSNAGLFNVSKSSIYVPHCVISFLSQYYVILDKILHIPVLIIETSWLVMVHNLYP